MQRASPAKVDPLKSVIEEFVRLKSRALLRKYGATGVGVGPRVVDGKAIGELAVVFYIPPVRGRRRAPAIPPWFKYRRKGEKAVYKLPTTVVDEKHTITFEAT